jgi:hypothetical protein
MNDCFDRLFDLRLRLDYLELKRARSTGNRARADDLETEFERTHNEFEDLMTVVQAAAKHSAATRGARDASGEVADDVAMRILARCTSGTLHNRAPRALIEVATRNEVIDRFRRVRAERGNVSLQSTSADPMRDPIHTLRDPQPDPEEQLIEHEARLLREFVRDRVSLSVATIWWVWADRMRGLVDKPALRWLVDALRIELDLELVEARRRVRAASQALSGHRLQPQPRTLPSLVPKADAMMGRFLLSRLNAAIQARGLERNQLDLRWQRLKELSVLNAVALPPGLTPPQRRPKTGPQRGKGAA